MKIDLENYLADCFEVKSLAWLVYTDAVARISAAWFA